MSFISDTKQSKSRLSLYQTDTGEWVGSYRFNDVYLFSDIPRSEKDDAILDIADMIVSARRRTRESDK